MSGPGRPFHTLDKDLGRITHVETAQLYAFRPVWRLGLAVLALVALLISIGALGTDIMLPALEAISADLGEPKLTDGLYIVGGFFLGMSQRLGLAGALLGDPKVLLFDEPVNGLDPEGIVWIRKFMQRLAAEGRTVLVSSHLLSEMAQTAEHLVVIGRGKLISDSSVQEFIDHASEASVRVRGPQLDALRSALTSAGLTVREPGITEELQPTLVVTNSTTDAIGEIAGRAGLVLHELSSQRGSLEEAFMKLTGDDVQYHGAGAETMGGAL